MSLHTRFLANAPLRVPRNAERTALLRVALSKLLYEYTMYTYILEHTLTIIVHLIP